FRSEPILDIHLIREGNLKYVIVFSVSGILLLFLGVINYVNLFIASVNKRIKEVGIRKSLGAGKSELIKQFFIESTLLCIIAFASAFVFMQLVKNPFSNFSGTTLDFRLFHNPINFLYILGLLVLIVLISSAYPAIYISSLKTINSLKGAASFERRRNQDRRTKTVNCFSICHFNWLDYLLFGFVSTTCVYAAEGYRV